ncbi:MAG TPA: arginine--tRNA ligase [Actinomycetota bacterium]|nr:arginine--tRNA ligase [Actinomycetota bacterium]
MIADHLAELLSAALAADGAPDETWKDRIHFERPRRREHGDWSTNVALAAAKERNANPRELAQSIVERIPASEFVTKVEVAGPGFLNFHLSPEWLHDVVRRAADPAARYGRSDAAGGKKVNVEFVSANPTGPVNVVSGRHAAVGDAIARLLEATGHQVTREFYLNDHGRQLLLFGESIATHYLRHFGVSAEIPEEGYRGDYVADLASEFAAELGDRLVEADPEERAAVLRDMGLLRMQQEMRVSLENFGTHYDVWFSERTLHESGRVSSTLDELQEKGLAEERDGALWFLSTKFGDDKDRVLVRANGITTYLAADAAYLRDKFGRGFEHLIYLWGADHHGTVTRLKGMAEALGHDRGNVEVRLVQVVTISAEGQAVKGSKRAGVFVTLDDLVAQVGVDAARYTFLTRGIDAPLHFDIEAAREQAPENPVYYVQYAHARICSILRRAAEGGQTADVPSAPLARLEHPSEDTLMRKLASFEEVVAEAAAQRAPQKVTRYVEELASDFSSFYRDCKVMTDDGELTAARLALCVATRCVIADALDLVGVSAPERM